MGNWLQLPAVGHTVYVFGVLLKPGKTLFVGDKVTYRNSPTPAAGYHSHRMLGQPTKFSIGLVAIPDDDKEKAFADEIVIFDPNRCLPRCIVAMKRLEDAP